MIFTHYKNSSLANVGVLVVLDILNKHLLGYGVIFLVSAAAFGLQVVGISTLVGCIRGTTSKYGEYLGSGPGAILLSFLFLVASALLLYFVRVLGVRIMVAYEGYCAGRLMERIRKRSANVKDLGARTVLTLLSKDCRFGGRIAQEIGNVVMPAGIALIAFPAMFYLNWQATLILLAVLAFNQLRAVPKVFANFHVFLAYFQRAFVLIHDIQDRIRLPAAAATPGEEDLLEET